MADIENFTFPAALEEYQSARYMNYIKAYTEKAYGDNVEAMQENLKRAPRNKEVPLDHIS